MHYYNTIFSVVNENLLKKLQIVVIDICKVSHYYKGVIDYKITKELEIRLWML